MVSTLAECAAQQGSEMLQGGLINNTQGALNYKLAKNKMRRERGKSFFSTG